MPTPVPRYLPVEDLKAWMRNDIPTDDDDHIARAIVSAEQWLDNELGRRVQLATGTASVRVFVPNGTPLLPIDDCVSVASVTENGNVVLPAAYQLEPLNGRSVAGEPVPFNLIRKLYDLDWYEDDGRATITLVADWGWASIPHLVVESCKIVAKDLLTFRRPDVAFGLVAITESAGGISARQNPIVVKTIEQYGSSQGNTLVDFIGIA